MRILVLNSGSSSLKFRLFDVPAVKAGGSPQLGRAVTQGAVKGIGGTATLEIGGLEQRAVWDTREVHDHVQALRWVVERLSGNPTEHPGEGQFVAVEAVGHRVVHGGDRFTEPVVITDAVEKEIDALSELAPLHNPACLAGIRGARAVLGSRIPMVAVFDTAFHRSLPDAARLYALPLELADRHHI
ncbi:MAG: acetate kinase, partial [Nitrospirae bacterium]